MRIDIVDLLERLEVDNVAPASKAEVNFSCPFIDGHALGDSNPSAYMNREKNVFFCQSCHARGTVIDFVARVRGIRPMEAMRFLRELYGADYREPEGGTLAAELKLMDERRVQDEVRLLRRPDERLWLGARGSFAVDWESLRMQYALGLAAGPGSYMLDRGFSARTLVEWELGYDAWSNRVTIPVRDEDGVLVGFKGRTIEPGRKPKYRVLGDVEGRSLRYDIGYGFDPYEVSHVVFGLHRAKASGSGRLVIVEGELDAIALHQIGVLDAVALGRSYVSDEQAELIRWWADEAVLFFDSDAAGEDCGVKAINQLASTVRVKVVGDHEGDPASMPSAASLELIESATPWMGLLAREV